MILWVRWEIPLRPYSWTVGGAGKFKVTSLMCPEVGGNYHLRYLSSPGGLLSFSSLDQLTYMVRALFQESKKWKLMSFRRMNLEFTQCHWSCSEASLLLHSICQCKLQSWSIFKRGKDGRSSFPPISHSAELEMRGLEGEASEVVWILGWYKTDGQCS